MRSNHVLHYYITRNRPVLLRHPKIEIDVMALAKLTLPSSLPVFLLLISAQIGDNFVIILYYYLIELIISCMSCSAGQQQQQQQQQCSVDSLPEFGDSGGNKPPTNPGSDRRQAIVPAYTFQCTGRVTEWRACVQPGGSASEQYYIQFQIWRPTANDVDGCYELVDYNIPLDDAREEEMNITDSTSIIEAEGFLSPPGTEMTHCTAV